MRHIRRSRALSGLLLALGMAVTLLLALLAMPSSALFDASLGVLETDQRGTRRLQPVSSVTSHISGGASDSYEVELASGGFLAVALDKGDLNALIAIHEPTGAKATELVARRYGRIRLTHACDTAGLHRLQVLSLEKGALTMEYSLAVEDLRDATARDVEFDLAMKAFAEAEKLRWTWQKESFQSAIKLYREAATRWEKNGFLSEAAGAYQNLGETYYVSSDYDSALECYSKALGIVLTANDRRREMTLRNSMAYTYLGLSKNETSLQYSKLVKDYCAGLAATDRSEQDDLIEAQALNNVGEYYYIVPDMKLALDHFERALAIWSRRGDRRGKALAWLNIGYGHTDSGNLQEALHSYKQSLALASEVDDLHISARSNTAIGGIYSFLGESQMALNSHEKALHVLRAMGDQQAEGAVLNGIGKAYEDLNDRHRALENYGQALKSFQAIRHRDFEALTIYYIGRVYRTARDYRTALTHYNQALRLSRDIPNLRIQAYALKDIALITGSRGNTRTAFNQYNALLDLYKRIEDRRGVLQTHISIGDLHYGLGRYGDAITRYQQALDLSRATQVRNTEIAILYGLARARHARGESDEALALIKESVEKIESLRSKVAHRDLRASFFSSAHKYYDLYISLLLEKEKQHPGRGYLAASFEASERYRARSLLDMLNEARVDIRQGVPPVLLERERSLRGTLSGRAEALTRLLSGKHSEEQARELTAEVDRLTHEYQRVEDEIRATSPRYAALTQPEPLSLDTIQPEALDDETLLLEYFLGEKKSILWVVGRSSITVHELASRAEIESASRQVYELLTARNHFLKGESGGARQERLARAVREYPGAVRQLSRMLLGKPFNQLGHKRLLIVADGALHYATFAAMPIPSAGPQQKGIPLVVEHEIVSLPSASTLVTLRREFAGRPRAPNLVAVLADPVFEAGDPRLETAPAGARLNTPRIEHTDLKDGAGGWARLLFTKQEAEGIIKVAPPGRVRAAFGFDANKSVATSSEMATFQIVHFATHGVVDSSHPELSGIVLSLLNRDGTTQDGFLRLHEIYNLRLGAELAVLSACETALGAEIPGEGLVGLTRGFMYAGSPRVVASLWSVRDEGTAELMKRFYRAMIEEGKPPSAALRSAQISMLEDGDWRSPYHWAGFTIQGEWR